MSVTRPAATAIASSASSLATLPRTQDSYTTRRARRLARASGTRVVCVQPVAATLGKVAVIVRPRLDRSGGSGPLSRSVLRALRESLLPPQGRQSVSVGHNDPALVIGGAGGGLTVGCGFVAVSAGFGFSPLLARAAILLRESGWNPSAATRSTFASLFLALRCRLADRSLSKTRRRGRTRLPCVALAGG